MGAIELSGVSAAYPYQAPGTVSAPEGETGRPQEMPSQGESESRTLVEMMEEARQKAEEHKKNLEKFQKSNTPSYSDAPMEAYSRLARAKNRTQVNAASGYARRRIAQLRQALRQDPDNASAIRASISQLQKAISRGEKKKRDLDRENLLEAQRARHQRERERQQEQRLRLELQRARRQRMIRESGYLREAEIDKRFQAYAAQTQMELRQQVQALAATSVPLQTALQQYAATSAAEISVETYDQRS